MRSNTGTSPARALRCSALLAVALSTAAAAADWTQWRGPLGNGTSPETGLVSSWSLDGENLLWRVDFTGRSTPVVRGDRVCANGRGGEDIHRQELVACFDVASGRQLWERRFNVYHTTVPWTRAGWPNPALDAETGYLYVQGVGGGFYVLDSADGSTVWERNFMEEFGFMEGYGGRTQTPLIDGDRVIVTFASTGWGSTLPPRHRIFSFDKRSGELAWISTPGTNLQDKNSQSTPVVVTAGGRRLIVHGNGDGHVYAVKAGTGEPVWDFHLSQRGINTSPVTDGKLVFIAHSEENVDEGTMGRVVAIDASGTGDVTASHEVWRAPLGVGFSSPALAAGKLYVLDNSANLLVLDAASGAEVGRLDLGRVGKASPVVADGKLYVTEVNGQMQIVDVASAEPALLDSEKIRTDGRWAEIYGSVAISRGRIFFTTEEGLYAIGAPQETAPATAEWTAPPGTGGGDPKVLMVMPAEVIVRPGDAVHFHVQTFNEHGEPLGPVGVDWSLEGLAGSIAGGVFKPDVSKGGHAGKVFAEYRGLSASARVRVIPDLPLHEDFEAYEVGARPPYQVAYLMPFFVRELDGSKVLAKEPSPQKIHRHISFLGAPDHSDYTIVSDIRGAGPADNRPDMGLINSGYTLELMGQHQLLELRSWDAARRVYQTVPFAWDPDVWYRMKLEVTSDETAGTVRAKVWKRGEPEPETWTIDTVDPHPIRAGSPGLSGYSPTPIYYDNIEVTSNR